MDEQQVQSYAELIEQLMWCAGLEEAQEIMQQHSQKIDQALLAVISSKIDHMQERGNARATRRLQQLQQIAADWIKVNPSSSLERVERSPSSSASRDTAGFIVESVQLILQTQGNRAQVYEFFRTNVERLDAALLQILPDVFSSLIPQDNPKLIATVFGEFGNLIQQFPLGQRWLNLEIGICAYEQALQVLTGDAFPEQWAGMQNNLANAYLYRIRGERTDNLERAIAAYEQSLQVMTRDTMPVEWAQSMMNLANAYRNRIWGDRAQNLEEAISAHKQSLQVRTRDAMPVEWAQSMNNLANVYCNRIRGDRAQNLEEAIAAYKQSLQVRTRDAMPVEWATSMSNLAIAYRNRIQGDHAQNLEDSIAAYEQA